MEHTLVEVDGLLRCSACLQRFTGQPTGKLALCLGAPTFQWDAWPEGMFTAKQIREKGFVPGPVRGVIPYSKSADGDGYLRVYRLDEATPKPPKTEKQLAAIEKRKATERAKRTCQRCGRVQFSKRDMVGGYCQSCDLILAQKAARRMAVLWARERRDQSFVILDTETTGLDPGYHEVIALALVDRTGRVLLDTYIKPQRPIIEKEVEDTDEDWRRDYPRRTAFGVNGITNAMVEHAPSFAEAWALAAPLLEGQRVIVYNADFDGRMLRGMCARHKLPKPDVDAWECLMLQFAAYYGDWSPKYEDWKFQSLSQARVMFGIPLDDAAHTAAGDCLTSLEVLKRMGDGCTDHELVETDELAQREESPWLFHRVSRCTACGKTTRSEYSERVPCPACGGEVKYVRTVENPYYGKGQGWFYRFHETIPELACSACGVTWDWLTPFIEAHPHEDRADQA